MICVNNADLLSQMATNNEIKETLILEKILVQKEHKSKQLPKKIQPDLGVYLQDDDDNDNDDNELVELIELDNLSLKLRRSKRLVGLNQKSKREAKVKKRSKPYLRNKKSDK